MANATGTREPLAQPGRLARNQRPRKVIIRVRGGSLAPAVQLVLVEAIRRVVCAVGVTDVTLEVESTAPEDS